MILLVIDTQKAVTDNRLYKFDLFKKNIKKLIQEARANNVEIVYVRHDDGPGEALEKGTDGYEIYDDFKPRDNEKIFDKDVNSAFRGTGLLEYLKDKSEKDLIITGLATDRCINATVICGFEHGFNLYIPAYANSTYDNELMTAEESYIYYNKFMWEGRYAKCCSVEETIDLIRENKK